MICRRLFSHYRFNEPDYHDIFKYLRPAYYSVLYSKNVSLLSALRSCVSASRAFLRAARMCGLSPTAYFRRYEDFYKHLELSRLRSHYEHCVESSEYCNNYYHIYCLDGIDASYLVGTNSEFSRFKLSEQVRFQRSIKHRNQIALLNINSNL